jgi:uncharacterized protein (TIGR03437 family)
LSYSLGFTAAILALCTKVALAQSSIFTLGGTFPVGSGSLGNQDSPAVVVADFNRDGNADIVTANTKDGTLTLLLGDGKGHFTEAAGSPIEATNKVVQSIATGDFNGDGNPDLVVTSSLVTEILLGDGKGGFSAGAGMPSPFNIPGAFGAGGNLVVVGDFNGDGKLDLLTWSQFGYSFVWLGDGTGGFGQAQNSPLYTSSSLTSIATGDFNGDGKLDLAATGGTPGGTLHVYLGDGTGRFPTPFELFLSNPGYGIGSAIAAGDFNGDGKSDLLTFLTAGYAPWQTWTWLWTGSKSTFLPFNEVTSSPPLGLPTFVVTADFNGDGHVDWAGVNPYSGTVLVALGDGTGALTPAPGSPYAVGGEPFGLATGDFNGDGKVDLAVDTGSSVVLLLNGNAYANGPLPFISTVVNAASYVAEALPPSSYAVIYGSNLAASVGDSTVGATFTDLNGNHATASVVYASPGQVNILVPDGLALGPGSMEISRSLGASVPFPIMIEAAAPGLFTVDTAGKIPAAQLLTVSPNGARTIGPVANCTAGTCTLLPITLDPANQTYLTLYGTGIRGWQGLGSLSVWIGGDPASVTYAGPQGGYPGLDQVNVLIPQNLAGSGQSPVKVEIESNPELTSNTVQLLFQ